MIFIVVVAGAVGGIIGYHVAGRHPARPATGEDEVLRAVSGALAAAEEGYDTGVDAEAFIRLLRERGYEVRDVSTAGAGPWARPYDWQREGTA